MWMKLIYPRWPKLAEQTPFHLPPHGPVVFAAEVPDDVDLTFVDDNVQNLDVDDNPDIVALSIMLTCQLPRAREIARDYRERGIKVIAGGIAVMLHAEEVSGFVDSVFLGEVEGRFRQVLDDWRKGRLQKVYEFRAEQPPIEIVGTARRAILDQSLYRYRGFQMVDLVHASRGCRFSCFPCAVGVLGGRRFRPRPIDKVVEEIETISNNRLFFVDNSLAQDTDWERELFRAIAPLKRKWISHPIEEDDEILSLAREAGCWYVYQAVTGINDGIRRRLERYRDHGIGVEATVLLGTDEQDADYVRRLVDFLLEMEVDMAEFTILTPFPGTPVRRVLEAQERIFDNEWSHYTCDRVVFRPKRMSPDELQEMYHYAWQTFYGRQGKQLRMARLFMRVMEREMGDGTWRRFGREGNRRAAER